jgi:hypothetical protein
VAHLTNSNYHDFLSLASARLSIASLLLSLFLRPFPAFVHISGPHVQILNYCTTIYNSSRNSSYQPKKKGAKMQCEWCKERILFFYKEVNAGGEVLPMHNGLFRDCADQYLDAQFIRALRRDATDDEGRQVIQSP